LDKNSLCIKTKFRDINDDDLENDIREAFRCFDKDALGYIPVPSENILELLFFFFLYLSLLDLTRILETLGDKLAPLETQVKILKQLFHKLIFRR
jgi:hypothetical protein